MEKWAEKLTVYTIKQGSITENDYEVYKYGFQIALEMIVYMVVSVLIAIYMNMLTEGLTFFGVFILLRSYAGGLHLKHYYSCFLCSCFVLIGTMLLVKNFVLPVSVAWIIIGSMIFGIKKFTPIENINRRLENEEKDYFARKINVILLCIALCSVGLGVIGMSKYVTTIAFTMAVVVLSMILGKIEFQRDCINLSKK